MQIVDGLVVDRTSLEKETAEDIDQTLQKTQH